MTHVEETLRTILWSLWSPMTCNGSLLRESDHLRSSQVTGKFRHVFHRWKHIVWRVLISCSLLQSLGCSTACLWRAFYQRSSISKLASYEAWCQECWLTLVFLALKKLRQEDHHECEVSLGYIERHTLKKKSLGWLRSKPQVNVCAGRRWSKGCWWECKVIQPLWESNRQTSVPDTTNDTLLSL